MIDTGKQYSAKEAADLGAQGYEFASVQLLGQRDPFYIVTSYDPPRATDNCVCHWSAPHDPNCPRAAMHK